MEKTHFGFGQAIFGFNGKKGFIRLYSTIYKDSEEFEKALLKFKNHLQKQVEEIDKVLNQPKSKIKINKRNTISDL